MAYPVEALLRKPVEYWSAVTALVLSMVTWWLQDYMLFTPAIGKALALSLLVVAVVRGHQGFRVMRYQRKLGQLRSFTLRRLPNRKDALYIGRGFAWTQLHTQRLRDTRTHEGMALLERLRPNKGRNVDALGGTPTLHTVGLLEGEESLFLTKEHLKGHIFVKGATGSGKTRVCEVFVEQDIRRGSAVIVFDPKGDADLLARVYGAAKRADRLSDLKILHLAHPDVSARYNPIGSYTRITQVAQRLSEPLPDHGSGAAFQAFAWRFSNIIARALSALGERPDLAKLRRYVNDLEPLMLRYVGVWLVRIGETQALASIESKSAKRETKSGYSPRARAAVACAKHILNRGDHFDPVVEGLVGVVGYDRTYYDKLVASLLPLLEKLTTGRVGELLSPDYGDVDDERDIIDWGVVIRTRGIVYVGLDALTDPVVAGAVGQAMFDDLTAVAGELYAYGEDYGMEQSEGDAPRLSTGQVRIHADELSAIASESVLNLLARGRGAGIELTAYSQTIHDLTVGLGDRDLANVALGNINTLVMMRVRDDQTARLMTDQLPRVEVQKLMQVSGAHDSAQPASDVEFTSSTQQRITTQEVPMLEPGDVTRLPLGHAFVLGEGGRLLKTRFPLPEPCDEQLPRNIQSMVNAMRAQGTAPERWWLVPGLMRRRSKVDVVPPRPADFAGGELGTDPMAPFEAASTDMVGAIEEM